MLILLCRLVCKINDRSVKYFSPYGLCFIYTLRWNTVSEIQVTKKEESCFNHHRLPHRLTLYLAHRRACCHTHSCDKHRCIVNHYLHKNMNPLLIFLCSHMIGDIGFHLAQENIHSKLYQYHFHLLTNHVHVRLGWWGCSLKLFSILHIGSSTFSHAAINYRHTEQLSATFHKKWLPQKPYTFFISNHLLICHCDHTFGMWIPKWNTRVTVNIESLLPYFTIPNCVIIQCYLTWKPLKIVLFYFKTKILFQNQKFPR